MDETSSNITLKDNFYDAFAALQEKIINWIQNTILILPNIFLAIIFCVLFYFLSKKSLVFANKYTPKITHQKSLQFLISRAISFVVLGLGLFVALSVLNLDKTLSSILAGAGVLGLAVGLAMQNTLANTFSGIFLSLINVINIGDWLETNGYAGKVIDINFKHTKILQPDNNIVILPNKLIFENPFKNYGLTSEIRVIVSCSVAYGSDLKKLKNILLNAINENFYDDKNHKPVEFYYENFGADGINFKCRFFIKATNKKTNLQYESEAIILIHDTMNQNGFEIPYATRTVHIESFVN